MKSWIFVIRTFPPFLIPAQRHTPSFSANSPCVPSVKSCVLSNCAFHEKVQALNTRLQNEVNPLTAEKQRWGAFRDGDRVIVTQNNSYYNICNGDVGVLYIRGEKPHRIATLAVRGTLKTWQIDCMEKYGAANDDAPPPRLALAYALTVHKSQGSQYDAILMPVSTATAKMLYRNLLYTAISRARKEVILVGSREAVNTAMQCIPYPRKSKLVARTNLLRLRRSA